MKMLMKTLLLCVFLGFSSTAAFADVVPPDGAAADSAPADKAGAADTTTPTKSGCDIAGSGTRFGFGFVVLFLGLLGAWRLTRKEPVPVRRD